MTRCMGVLDLIAAIPDPLRDRRGGIGNHGLVLAIVADRTGEYGTCYPRMDRIAETIGVDPKTVYRICDDLVDAGLLDRVRLRHRRSGNLANYLYRVVAYATAPDPALIPVPVGFEPADPIPASWTGRRCPVEDRTSAGSGGPDTGAESVDRTSVSGHEPPNGDPPNGNRPTNPEPDGSSSSPDVDEPVDEPTTTVAEEGWETAKGLCEYLADAIVETGVAGTKRPNVTRAWVAEMERMIRLDGRDPDHVRRAIEWAHRGPGSVGNGNGWAGWGAVVRSPSKLRAKYDQMAQQAEARRRGSNGKANGTGYTGDDFRRAAAALREQGR